MTFYSKQLIYPARRLLQIRLLLLALLAIVFLVSDLGLQKSMVFGICLVAASIPFGLLPTLTIIVKRLARLISSKDVLVDDLSDIEKLASTNIITMDSVGGLAKKESVISQVLIGRDVYKISSRKLRSMELALAAVNSTNLNSGLELDSSPYKHGAQELTFFQGAPSVVFKRSTEIWDHGHIRKLTAKDRERFAAFEDRQAKDGNTTLALAYREPGEKNLTLLGIVSVESPLASSVASIVRSACSAHINLLIFTDDLPDVAKGLAQKAGLGESTQVLDSKAIAKLTGKQLLEVVANNPVIFSRVSAKDKRRVIQLVNRNGLLATEADAGLKNVLDAIRISRLGIKNIIRAIKVTLLANVAEILIVVAGLIAFAFYHVAAPLTLVGIVIIDVVALILPLYAISWDGSRQKLMLQKPRNIKEYMINDKAALGLLGFGTVVAVISYANFFFFFFRHNLSPTYLEPTLPLYHQATSLTVVTIILCIYTHLLFERADHHENFFTDHLTNNKKLLYAFGASFVMIFILLYTPWLQSLLSTGALSLLDWTSAIFCASLYACFRLLQRHTRKHTRHAILGEFYDELASKLSNVSLQK